MLSKQNKIVAKLRVQLILKISQYEKNDFCIKNLKNFCIQYWFRGEAGFTGRLAFRGDWLRRETGFAGGLASRGHWIRGETDFAGRLALRGDWFLVTLAKIFTVILVVKQINYNAKVSDITIL